jgi:chorismate mutase
MLMHEAIKDERHMDAPLNLADIRSEIDALDAQLRALLLARADLVAQVAASKAQTGSGPILRPAREAAQMAALMAWQKEHAPHLALPGIIAIWREIIGLAIAQQGGLTIFITAASETAARAYFGASLSYELCASPEAAFEKMAASADSIAVLAKAEARAPEGAAHIFAHLPVDQDAEAAQAVCYGTFDSDDISGAAQ